MTQSFDETYKKYPFSRLVWFGLLLASFAVSLARNSHSKSDMPTNRMNQHRARLGLGKIKRRKA